MTNIKNTLINSKPYLMYLTVIVSALHILGFFNFPFWLFFSWTFLILLCDAKEMIQEYLKKHFLFSLVIIALLISFIINIKISDSTGLLNIWLIFQNYYIFYCANRNKELNFKTFKITVLSVLGIFTFFSLINLVDFSLNLNWFAQDLIYSRLSGIYRGPNQMGICAGIAIAASIPLIKSDKTIIKSFSIISILLQGYMLFLSNCRSVLIAMVLIITIYALSIIYRKTNKTIFIICLITCLILLLGGIYFIIIYRHIRDGKLISILSEELPMMLNRLSAGRYYVWQSAFDLFLKKPLFGVGPLNIYKGCCMYLTDSYVELKGFQNAHQFLLELAVYGGLVSFIPFIIWLFRNIIIILKSKNNDIWYYSGLMIAFIIFFFALLDVAILFDTHSYTYLFWLSFGYCINTNLN